MKKNEGEMKKSRSYEKYLWFIISLIIVAAGYFLRSNDIDVPVVGLVGYAVLLIGSILIASQKTSNERFSYAKNEDQGVSGDRKKYALSSLLYYFFILVSVLEIVFTLWVCKIFYI